MKNLGQPRISLRGMPAWLFGMLALMALIAIPHIVDWLELPEKPVFARLRSEAPRGLVEQCLASAVFMTFYAVRRRKEVAESEIVTPRIASPQRWQFSIADLLILTAALAACMSLWRLSGKWWLAALAGTFFYQAYLLYHAPSRGVFIALLVTWGAVAAMILLHVG